jgi:hypothetical protein
MRTMYSRASPNCWISAPFALPASRAARFFERQLHHRAAGEVDAVVEAALDEEGHEPDHDERDREARHHPPPADEVVLGIVQDAQHQMLSVSAALLRLSQMR